MRVCVVKVDEINFYQLISIHAILIHLNLDYDKENCHSDGKWDIMLSLRAL